MTCTTWSPSTCGRAEGRACDSRHDRRSAEHGQTIVAVTPKAVGKTVEKGRNIATVESGKWVGPVSAPISGEIVAVNEALVVSPSLANSDPYGAGWVARMRPFDWESDVADLVTGPEGIELYRRFLDAEGIACD